MKEKEMVQPNNLGHYHRDIVSATVISAYHMQLILSCGHKTVMSRAGYKKCKDHATLCIACSKEKTK